MTRVELLDKVFTTALNNASLTLIGVAQTLHRGVPEVKNVAVIAHKDKSQYTYTVLFHDRERLCITLHRMAELEMASEGEREVMLASE